MPAELYLNKTFFDTQRRKYRPTAEINSGENWIEMMTEDNKLLVMFHDLDDSKQQQSRLEWLFNISSRSELDDILVFPSAALTGLKRSEIGYISEPNNATTLNCYIHPGKGEKLFKWYCDKTGGIAYRLKIAYSIANALQRVHANGYCLVDICPNHVQLQEYNTEKEPLPAIQFSGADRISSYTFPAETIGTATYCDPLVYLKRSGVSTYSDAYSFAVLIFELLTTCHPFIGEDAEGLSGAELSSAVDSGKLDYIGDTCSSNNKSENFEYTQIFLPQDLAALFERMFVEGKYNASARPTIDNFKSAIIQSIRKIIKCDHKGCEREYPYNDEHLCPFCDCHTERVITARIKKIISASEKLLLPYDGIKGFSTLPVIEEEANFMVIKAGTNKITRSCFEPSSTTEKANIGLLLHYSPKKKLLGVRNHFKKLDVAVDGKVLTPYTKADKGQHSDTWFPDNRSVSIELPDNAQIEPEAIVQIESDEYGLITHKWIVTIR